MDNIRNTFVQVWKGFQALDAFRRMTVLIVAFLTMAGIITMGYWMGRPEYRVLFSHLNTDDASNIVAKLQEKKTPYRLSESGDSILVPAEKITELRLELAAQGLPQGGGVGFEIFDGKSIGATEFTQQMNYQRALQGELSRTIRGLDEIQHCRVHLAIPKKSLFVEEQKKPTASVILKLKSGKSLRPAQIDGIAHLVASSVEGMSSADVMVVDSSGKMLSKLQDDSKASRLSSSQIDYQRGIEKDLTNRIQSMIERVVGEGKAVVRVTADIDFRMMEKTEEKYDPEEPVVRSVQRQIQKTNTQIAPTVGGQSTVTPLSSKQGDNQANKQGTGNERLDEVVNYEINRVVSKTVMPIGEIKKLSVAVLVDGPYTKNEKGMEEFQPRSKKEMTDIEELVKKAVGFDAKRGDQVVITNIAFSRGESDAVLTGKESWHDKIAVFSPIIKQLIFLATIALLILFVIRPLIKMLMENARIREAENRSYIPSADRIGIEGSQMNQLALWDKHVGKAIETDIVRQMANADARRFADLLRSWLK